jgi:uncharacterized protein (TIGR00296 family)
MISSEDRKSILSLARSAIEKSLLQADFRVDAAIMKKFSNAQGAFVTLKEMGELRGCIGYPEPVLPLWQAVLNSAIAAAFEDPRFPQVISEEMKDIKIEVSVLSVPRLIEVKNPDDYLKEIKVGRDGLIIKYRGFSGLLLPQVAPEQGWNSRKFLEGLCEKAGVSPVSWRNPRCEIYSFEAEVFGE